jgi:hypothetical protein
MSTIIHEYRNKSFYNLNREKINPQAGIFCVEVDHRFPRTNNSVVKYTFSLIGRDIGYSEGEQSFFHIIEAYPIENKGIEKIIENISDSFYRSISIAGFKKLFFSNGHAPDYEFDPLNLSLVNMKGGFVQLKPIPEQLFLELKNQLKKYEDLEIGDISDFSKNENYSYVI